MIIADCFDLVCLFLGLVMNEFAFVILRVVFSCVALQFCFVITLVCFSVVVFCFCLDFSWLLGFDLAL